METCGCWQWLQWLVGRGGFWMGWGVDKEERGRDFGELLRVRLGQNGNSCGKGWVLKLLTAPQTDFT